MATRNVIALAVVVTVQALAGCSMPAKGGVAGENRSHAPSARLDARDLRLRAQVEAGTFGLAQLYPGGMATDARNVPPLPPPSAVPIPAIPVPVAAPVAQSIPFDKPVHVAFAAAAAGDPNGCVYKPVMSDADIDACR